MERKSLFLNASSDEIEYGGVPSSGSELVAGYGKTTNNNFTERSTRVCPGIVHNLSEAKGKTVCPIQSGRAVVSAEE